MIKYHAECQALGRPRPGSAPPKGGVRAAAESADDLLTFRVERGGGGEGKTFFFVKDEKALAALKDAAAPYRARAKRVHRAEVPYAPDLSSRTARPTRRVPGAGPLAVALRGDGAFPAAVAVGSGGTATLAATKRGLGHTLTVEFAVDGDRVTARSCRLVVAPLP